MDTCELKQRTISYRKSLNFLLLLILTLLLEIEIQTIYFQIVPIIDISLINLYYNKCLCIQNFMITPKKLLTTTLVVKLQSCGFCSETQLPHPVLVVQWGLEPGKPPKSSLQKREAIQCPMAGCRQAMLQNSMSVQQHPTAWEKLG